MIDKNRKKKSLFGKLIRWMAYVVIGFLILSFVTTGILYIYRDQIGKQILMKVNKVQKGELQFTELTFDPFVHFPVISMRLKNVVYSIPATSDSLSLMDTIAEIDDIYGSIDLWRLIYGQINISRITIEEGNIRLIERKDGKLNIMDAFSDASYRLRDDSRILLAGINPEPIQKQLDSGQDNDSLITIFLDRLSMKNIGITYASQAETNHSEIFINDLNASLSYEQDSINSQLKASLLVLDLPYIENLLGNDLNVDISTALTYYRGPESISIYPSKLKLGELIFEMEGNVDLTADGSIDVMVNGSDKNFSIVNSLVQETFLEKLKSGDIYFNGFIKGPLGSQLPEIDLRFGLSEVVAEIPATDQVISNLNLSGHFKSGIKKDLSSAELRIDTMYANLPDGFMNASMGISNFDQPSIDYKLDLQSGLYDFSEAFSQYGISELNGFIMIRDRFIGTFDSKTGYFEESSGRSEILMDSISFTIDSLWNVESLSARLQRAKDTLEIRNLYINTGHSDMSLNGKMTTLWDMIFGIEKELFAELHITSDTFDLPRIFEFEPIVGRSFPYRLINANIAMEANTTTRRLTEFSFNPEINFNITKMETSVEDLFQPMNILGGNILLAEKEGRIYMEFRDCIVDAKGSRAEADVTYYSPPVDPDHIEIHARFDDLNPGNIFVLNGDSVPDLLSGSLSGPLHAELEIGLDTLIFESFDLSTENMEYLTTEDTIILEDFSISSSKVHWGEDSENQPLADMSLEAQLNLGSLHSQNFKLSDVQYNIVADKGVFNVYPEQFQFFGKQGKGIYILSPFKAMPTYKIQYAVENFMIEDLLVNLLVDTLVAGPMNFDIDVLLTQHESGDIFSSAEGFIHISSHDLNLYGIDVDDMIKKYNRSQKISLVDIGAVMVAGPYGLAVTKGSDFMVLALGNMGESSQITELTSDWKIKNGIMIIEDVAFATTENRIAAKGWIDLATDSLDVTIAVLDKNGCNILSQTLFGSLQDPEVSEIKVVSKVFGSITNLVNGALGKDCEVFYAGKVLHPGK